MNLIRVIPAEESEMTSMPSYPIALTIAGSDSSGGAGIQADLKTFSALATYGASVIVALTAQNTKGVTAIHPVPADFVTAQMDAVFSDLDVAAVKIGMLGSPDLIAAVAAGLRRHGARNIVLDPVMIAATGARLLPEAAITALRDELMPLADLVTPNMMEAAALLDAPMALDEREMSVQADRLRSVGAKAVLVKGGHGQGATSTDVLVGKDMRQRYVAQRIATANTHGTGCTLSSAIAAGLAHGMGIEAAISAAKDYVTKAIAASGDLNVGSGYGPVQHFHTLWN